MTAVSSQLQLEPSQHSEGRKSKLAGPVANSSAYRDGKATNPRAGVRLVAILADSGPGPRFRVMSRVHSPQHQFQGIDLTQHSDLLWVVQEAAQQLKVRGHDFK